MPDYTNDPIGVSSTRGAQTDSEQIPGHGADDVVTVDVRLGSDAAGGRVPTRSNLRRLLVAPEAM